MPTCPEYLGVCKKQTNSLSPPCSTHTCAFFKGKRLNFYLTTLIAMVLLFIWKVSLSIDSFALFTFILVTFYQFLFLFIWIRSFLSFNVLLILLSWILPVQHLILYCFLSSNVFSHQHLSFFFLLTSCFSTPL